MAAIDAMSDCVFPEDVMVCILTRLPVKSIVRFKSVCKPWLKLFSNPRFIKLHHQHQSSQSEALIIYSLSVTNLEKSIHTMSLFNIDEESSGRVPTNLDHPFSQYVAHMDFVGCVNGMVCISNSPFGQWIYLWNPALKLSKELPLHNLNCGKEDMVSVGFGYDADGDDFKIVRIVCVEDDEEKKKKNGFECYSAKSDSWTVINVDFDIDVSGTRNDAIVNGNPCWDAIMKENENGAVSDGVCVFDAKKMVFKFASLSSFITTEERKQARLADWNGSLALLAWKKIDDQSWVQSIKVWVFDASKKNWTLNHTFWPIELTVDRLVRCTMNGKIAGVTTDEELFVFDSLNGCVKEIYIDGAPKCSFDVCRYSESLACITGMKKEAVIKRRTTYR